MILCDRDIRELCEGSEQMIQPFSEPVSGEGVISFGLSSCGYDLRLAPEFKMFKNTRGRLIDPKLFHDLEYADSVLDTFEQHSVLTLPAGGYVLARSVEFIRMPCYLSAVCLGKSTYARSGILVNCTPLEPGWQGHLTLEIGNVTPCPAVLYVGEGIAQLQFHRLYGTPEHDYGDKRGQYQDQRGVTVARVKG